MDGLLIAAIILGGYLMGSIPSAYIAGRLTRGIDMRTVGSRNVGAVNTFHQVGPGAAAAVLAADTLKGALAVLLALGLSTSPWACVYGAAGVVAGHNWPLFLGFRGGKGVAPALGVSFAVLPWLTLAALGPAVLVIALSRNVVLSAATGFGLLNVAAVVTGQGWIQVLLCLGLTLVVTATYLGRSWGKSLMALRQRRWQDLFAFE